MHSTSVVRFLLVLLALTSLTLCIVVGESGPSDVITLTPDTFDEFVGRDVGTIVKFYAPWCGHCKALAPEYAAAASAFKSHSSTVRVASVDCDQFDAVCARFNIRGYPTLLWFPANASGRYEEYTSSNTASAIVAFLNANTGLTVTAPKSPSAAPKAAGKPGAVSSVLTLTPENVKEHIGGPVPILVEFFAPWCGHCKNLAPHYELAAQAFRDAGAGDRIKVAALDADAYPSIGHEFGVKGFPTLKYFPANSNVAIDYTGGRTAQAIVDYLNDKIEMKVAVPESADFDSGAAAAAQAKVAFAYPSVVHLTKDNIDDIIGGSVPVLVEFYAPWCQHCKSFAPEYEEAASMFVNVAGAKIAALDGDAFPTLATRFNVKGFPTILYFPAGSKEGKEYDGPRTSAGLVKYVNAQAGTQAQVPGLPQLDGPSAVVQLNNDNFETIVEDESKNVIVYFYAPWCPHCKRLSPEYEKAALELVGDAGAESNLVIAALDCDEYPKLAEHIEGFPTIMFYGQLFEDTAATDVVVKKVPTEIELSPSTTKDQLVKFIRDHVAGSVAPSSNAAPASTDDSTKATSDSSTAAGTATGVKVAPQAGQTITLSNEVADGTFFNCDVSSSAEGGKFPEGIELRIDAKYAEVQGFPATFSIDAEQFATYNWQAKPLSTIGQEATVTVQFVGSVPETVSFKCYQGKQSTKPDVATVSN